MGRRVTDGRARRWRTPTGNPPIPGLPLRPYQITIYKAVMRAIESRESATFSVEMARQAGKNETSAWIELSNLLRHQSSYEDAIKAAPTLQPQALISHRRLLTRLHAINAGEMVRREGANVLRLGSARQVFLSAEPDSNVVGFTAHTLLEVDEAQDVDADKFDREFRPMAAATGAVTVFYGTAWTSDTLLERMKQHHLELQRKGGEQRHFRVTWEEVAKALPAYSRFVEGERERLGEANPQFRTQYCLEPIAGAGRLLSPAALAQLFSGGHERLHAPRPGERYAAGLDIGGAGESPDPDATVLSVVRVRRAAGDEWWDGEPALELVEQVTLRGVPATELVPRLLSLLRHVWRPARVAVDSTGLGAPIADQLEAVLGSRLHRYRFTAESKSRLGYALVAAVTSGRLRCYAGDGSPEYRALRSEAAAASAHYRPNETMAWGAAAGEGHDDHLVSLALAVVAAGDAGPRVARGRMAA